MANVFVQADTMREIAEAIRGKRGIQDPMKPGEMAEQIRKIRSGGSSGEEEKPIRFYDFDGTLLYSYTFEELDELEELPAFPVHEGLNGEGWNWTLEDLKEEGREMNVGPLFVTDNGATRFYMELDEYTLDLAVNFFQSIEHGVKVDWGDGSPLESGDVTGTYMTVCLEHTYAEPGRYVIQLIPQGDVEISFRSGSSSYGSSFFSTASDWREDVSVMQSVKKMEMGSNIKKMDSYCFSRFYDMESVTIPRYLNCSSGNGIFCMSQKLKFFVFPPVVTNVTNYAFTESYGLEIVSIPKNVLVINTRAFTSCHFLRSVTLHKGLYRLQEGCFNDCFSLKEIEVSSITTLDKSVFQKCRTLRKMEIPEGITTVKENMLADCYSIRMVRVPDSVTAIDRYVFSYCSSLRELYFYPKTPPQISTTGVFSGLGSRCKIYVPKGCLGAYQAVDVLRSYMDQIVEMEE